MIRFTAFPDIRPWEIDSSPGPRWAEPQKARGRCGKLHPARLPLQRGETLLGRPANRRRLQSICARSTQTGDCVTVKAAGFIIGLCQLHEIVLRSKHKYQTVVVFPSHCKSNV